MGKGYKRIRFRTAYWDYGTKFSMAAMRGERGQNQIRAVIEVRFRRFNNSRPSFKVLVDMRRKMTRYLRDASQPTNVVRKAQRKRRWRASHPV